MTRGKGRRRNALGRAALCALLLAAGVSSADGNECRPSERARAVMETAGYWPAKLGFALAGLIPCAFTRPWTDEVCTKVLRGDWVVRCDHVQGNRDLEFFGSEEPDGRSQD